MFLDVFEENEGALGWGHLSHCPPQRELNYPKLEQYGVKIVPVSQYADNPMVKQYEESTFLDTPGWSGFWDLTLKRHIYYYLLMEEQGIDEAIHIETDVVPYLDINKMFDRLIEVYRNKLCFTSYQDYQLSAHFLYCSDREVLRRYAEAIPEYLKEGEGEWKKKWPGQVIIAENHFAYQFYEENKSQCGLIPTMPDEECFKNLGFLIDPQAYGMWLSGTRFDPGVPYYANTHHIGERIGTGWYDVVFNYRDGKKCVPYLMDTADMKTYPIGAIHFNSKEPEQWI